MVSDQTIDGIQELVDHAVQLKKIKRDEVTLLVQRPVAAVVDVEGTIALRNGYGRRQSLNAD